jgi:hypothetical protein
MKNKESLEHDVYNYSFNFGVFVSAFASKTIKKNHLQHINFTTFLNVAFSFSTLNAMYFTILGKIIVANNYF